MVTGIYAALLALMQVLLTLRGVAIRRKDHVSIGDGGDETLARRMRVHGNFIETVPIALILILIAELGGAPLWTIHILGVLLTGGRIIHAIGLSSPKGFGKFRFYGMVTTINAIILAALLCLWLAALTALGA